MFTGIIEDIGQIRSLSPGRTAVVVRVATALDPASLALGDSVAVDGVCLTLTEVQTGWFAADASPETVARSTLAHKRPGAKVNLERALTLATRLGGHLVQGHVDATGTLTEVAPVEGAWRLRVEAPAPLLTLCVGKGSVAIDGVSLTINRLDPEGFEVMVIPHTYDHCTLGQKKPGDAVNLEADIIGKYVARMLGVATGASGEGESTMPGGITEELLRKHGFWS